MAKKNLIVGQSGGPTAVINSSLYGVVSEGIRQEEIGHVYGMVNGIEGFLKAQSWILRKLFPGKSWNTSLTPQVLILAPAAISFPSLWRTRYTRNCSAGLKR